MAVPSFNATVDPPVGAACARVTVHFELAGVTIVAGVHESALTAPTCGANVREKLLDVPFRVAAAEVVVAAETAAALMVKVAVVAPAGTSTEAGMVTADMAVPSFNATVDPPVGAACARVTVHFELAGVTIVAGVHERALTAAPTCSGREKVAELPDRLATRIAVAGAAIVPALTAKVALLAFAAIVTDEGMLKLAELDPKPNAIVSAVDVGAPRLTVQLAVPGVTRGAGLQTSFESLSGGARVSVALFPVVVSITALEVTAIGLAI
jgi:hypothetical protein